MKTIKFKAYLAELVLSGKKTATWRLFDDKDLQVGDELELVNSDTKEKFANARIVGMREKRLGDMTDADCDGHETYASQEAMVEEFKKYYGDKASLDTKVKIIEFKIE